MTYRVLGPHERGRFAPEAWGYLLKLSARGALTPMELELMIERALSQVDGRIALEDLQTILDGTGVDDSGSSSDNQTVH